jgi:hypothetical protein
VRLEWCLLSIDLLDFSQRISGGDLLTVGVRGGGAQSAVNDHILALRLFRLITIHLQENIEDTGGIQGRDKPGDTAGGYSRRVTQQGQEG